MPRALRSSGDMMVFNLVLLRYYLRTARVENGFSILDDCFHSREPGAIQMVMFALNLRGNIRTRRSLHTVRTEWRQQGRANPPAAARWYTALAPQGMGMFRQWHRMAYPLAAVTVDTTLQQRLTRSVRRMLGYAGVVKVKLPTLGDQARVAVQDLRTQMRGQLAVMWVDNWYWERYSTNPSAQPERHCHGDPAPAVHP